MNKNIFITNNIIGDKMQKIKCKVHDCKYCNCEKNLCELTAIEIVNCISGKTPKELTMCDSYKSRKS